MRPIGIDLFAGAGGLSLGFEQAGFDVKAAVEIDPVHCAVHEFNFPNTKVISESVETLTGKKIRKLAGIEGKPIDCVFGGAPCQGFSLIGHRALEDPRNKLVGHFVKLVKQLDSKCFVFENVKGLTVGKHKSFLDELVHEFDQAGYECRLKWQVLNAAHFGTPQSRERFILLGAKKGKTVPDYPQPITNISGRPKFDPELDYGPSCHEAIGDLPDADRFESLTESDAVKTSRFNEPSAYAAELRCLTNDPWHFGYPRQWEPGLLTSSARTQHTEISRRRFRETEEGKVEPISRFFKLPSDGVSNTLRAGTDGARGAFTSPRPIHYRYPRCITVREMARLHGFPDWFRLHATKWHGARQIGNAVPPPMARAIAEKVIEALGVAQNKPEKSLKLGNPRLLTLTLSEASASYGINPPPSRRDRKSGAKKRKQEEIEVELNALRVANG
ncbi:DNA cytosine methyltransferase [Roseibium marinum]|uniref:Cytosine-specific methyltransferase n=1 Tax=Roseibium marinum TaxID=281252 RepID=A0A2S3V3E3_9HYPH|nr:DNA cytosine methyltransferase [Roseibium marinum]POF34179.1 DNA (cytosine-5)-methyltransferase 1 [Roseibium marinum]